MEYHKVDQLKPSYALATSVINMLTDSSSKHAVKRIFWLGPRGIKGKFNMQINPHKYVCMSANK